MSASRFRIDVAVAGGGRGPAAAAVRARFRPRPPDASSAASACLASRSTAASEYAGAGLPMARSERRVGGAPVCVRVAGVPSVGENAMPPAASFSVVLDGFSEAELKRAERRRRSAPRPARPRQPHRMRGEDLAARGQRVLVGGRGS